MAWNRAFLTISPILELKSSGLTLLVLVLSDIERRLINGTVAIHLLKFMAVIFNDAKSILWPKPGFGRSQFLGIMGLHSVATRRGKCPVQLTKNSFINRKSTNLSNSNSSCDFWHLANNISNDSTSSSFSHLIQLDGSIAVSSFSKAELFVQTFTKNSNMDDTGHIPPTSSPSDYFIFKIKILHYDVFNAISLALILGSHIVRMDSFLLFSKTMHLNSLVYSFVCVSLLLPILFAGNVHTLNQSLKN